MRRRVLWSGLLGALAGALPAGAQTPPPAAVTPTPTPPQVHASDAEIIRNGQGSLIFVEGKSGAGSGFIVAEQGQKYLVTNAHVMAGNTPVTLTKLDGSSIAVGGAAVAVGHDMVRFAVAANQPAFTPLENAGQTLLVGDEVLVLGNAYGARVVNPISGKVVGLGPNLVEVDAPFQPGNSGSPIIQKKTGRVIGIATFVREKQDDREAAPKRMPEFPGQGGHKDAEGKPRELRRFGFRLDTVKSWQPINWPEFEAEAADLKAIDERSNDIVSFMQELNQRRGNINPGGNHTAGLQRLLQSFGEQMAGHPSREDAFRAQQDFLDGLARLCTSDLAEFRPRLQYDYFQREAAERQQFRDALAKSFDAAIKSQSANER